MYNKNTSPISYQNQCEPFNDHQKTLHVWLPCFLTHQNMDAHSLTIAPFAIFFGSSAIASRLPGWQDGFAFLPSKSGLPAFFVAKLNGIYTYTMWNVKLSHTHTQLWHIGLGISALSLESLLFWPQRLEKLRLKPGSNKQQLLNQLPVRNRTTAHHCIHKDELWWKTMTLHHRSGASMMKLFQRFS